MDLDLDASTAFRFHFGELTMSVAWSSGLTVWDRLHGTLRLGIPQEKITIGIPAYRDPCEVTMPKILTMPFGEQRPTWELPGESRES